MAPNTAFAFVLVGIVLWILSGRDPPYRGRVAGIVAGLVVASLGALTLIEYITGWSLGIDELIFKDPRGAVETAARGRMTGATAVNFMLLGVAVALMAARRAHRTAQALCLFACGLSLVALTGHLYDVRALYAMGSFTGIAFLTVITFLVAGLGLLAADPGHGVTALLTNDTIGGLMVRRVLPFAVAIPVFLGWLERNGRRAGLYQDEFGVALLVVASIVLIGIVVAWQGAALGRIDRERSEGEEALRESERRFSLAFHMSPIPTSLSEIETGRFLDVNEKFLQVFGYSREEVIGRTSLELKVWADRSDRDRIEWSVLQEGSSENIEIQIRTGSGELRRVSGSVVRIEIGTVPCALSTFLDITERKRTETALRESERQFRAVFDGALDGMLILDDEGRCLEVNAAAGALYGRPPRECLGTRLGTFSDVDFAAVWPRFLASGHARGEARVSRPDGTKREIEFVSTANFLPGRHLSILHDITDRKLAEEEVRHSEQRVRALMENAIDAIYVLSLDGIVLEANRAAEEQQGRPRAELVGRPLVDAVPPEEREAMVKGFQETLSKGNVLGFETLALRADGKSIPIEVSAAVVPVGERQLVHAIVRDVSARRQLEDQLRQSQKMEAVGRLAGGIAHDFNNLLTVITGYAELAAGQLKPEDPLRIELHEIHKAAQRAADLTRQLLAFSRRQVLQPRVINLNRVVGDTDKMLRRLIGEDIELVTLLMESLGSVRADTGQIEQVLLNLAVNSRDAMPKGGKLTIETSEVELDESYAALHFDVPPGRYVLLAVSDTGSGMDAKTLSHVFEPFFTTKEVGKGTGLGLSTVYGVVKQSGGHVTVYSERGVGTTFKIYLPRVEDAPERARRSPSQTRPAGGTETVLVVEDEEAVRRLACQSLEAHGYKPLPAASASEALLLCEKHHGELHLMLTDVVMPHVSGRELAQRAAAFRPQMKVLFMSGYTDNAIVHHGVLDAGTPFLQKPFTPRSLAQKVREVLDAGESTGE
jgi:two-component system cell cycle sensor histidine kinase/response regulator CckA